MCFSENSLTEMFVPASFEIVVMTTPAIPHGVMAWKPERLSFVMFMANPCMEIHFLTPTPMEQSLRFSTQTPVRPSLIVAGMENSSLQASTSECSIALMYVCRSFPSFFRSIIGYPTSWPGPW